MDYYFQDNLRWSLGWETPNQAGAFLAALLPLCWLISSCLWPIMLGKTSQMKLRLALGFGFVAVAAVECWLWWALAKTYSRGAWAGVACGAIAWGGLLLWKRITTGAGRSIPSGKVNLKRLLAGTSGESAFPRIITLARAGVVVTCLLVSNFSARLGPDYTLSDRSALNRIDLWKGGLELVAASPLRGWGWGESGAAYMQWTQPIDRTEGYKSMVNSYLTVAVEAGLPLFVLLLTALLIPLSSGVWLVHRGSGWRVSAVLGLTACWATWLGCLFFSNLWIIKKLWIAPALAAGALVAWSVWILIRRKNNSILENDTGSHSKWDLRPITHYVGTPLAVALVIALASWFAGELFARATPFQLTRESANSVKLRTRETSGLNWIDVYPDAKVLGETYGHELRRWLRTYPQTTELRIQSPVTTSPIGSSSRIAVIFGEQSARVPMEGRRVVLVHPLGVPPPEVKNLAEGSRMVVAGIDPTGQRYEWESWAKAHRLVIEVNQGISTDVRLRWPEVLKDLTY